MYHNGSGTGPRLMPLAIAVVMAVGMVIGLTVRNPIWWRRKSYFERGWNDPEQ